MGKPRSLVKCVSFLFPKWRPKCVCTLQSPYLNRIFDVILLVSIIGITRSPRIHLLSLFFKELIFSVEATLIRHCVSGGQDVSTFLFSFISPMGFPFVRMYVFLRLLLSFFFSIAYPYSYLFILCYSFSFVHSFFFFFFPSLDFVYFGFRIRGARTRRMKSGRWLAPGVLAGIFRLKTCNKWN